MIRAINETHVSGSFKYSHITLPLNLCHDLINFLPQLLLPRYDLRDLGVELLNINDLAGVLLLDVGGDGEVIILPGNFVMGDEGGKVRLARAAQIRRQDRLDVVLGEFVAVGDLDALFGCVQKQRMR